MTRIDGVNCGYTKQGNPYKKSSTGKNVGTALGIGTAVAAANLPYATAVKIANKIAPKSEISQALAILSRNANKLGIKSFADFAHKFVKGRLSDAMDRNIMNLSIDAFKNSSNKLVEFGYKLNRVLKNSTKARFAFVTTALLASYAILGGVGRTIGNVYDKIADKGAKAEADRRAAQEA